MGYINIISLNLHCAYSKVWCFKTATAPVRKPLVTRLADETTATTKMDKIIYKTQPRLFILSMTFLGFVFFGLLFLLTFQGAQDDYNLIISTVLVLFAILSLTSLFYLLTVKTIKLTKDNLVISHLLLPISRTLILAEIKNMEQTKKEVKAVYGVSWTPVTFTLTLQLQ